MGNPDLTREHPDPYAGDLPPLVVDRQRIIQSSAFRRLQYKTQVFVARRGDHFRSRLTHTLEVANFARLIASELGLCADLAEVVALAHDLGHPPFGHAGERALHKCLGAHGGRFEHNEQTHRLVTYLEHPYPEFRGLNLTAAVRQCVRTHGTRYDRPETADAEPQPPEGQVVGQADQLAYTLHDLQDGLYAGLLDPQLLADVELWSASYAGTDSLRREDLLRHLRPTVERIQHVLIADLKVQHERSPDAPIELSEPMQRKLDMLAAVLHDHVYRHRDVIRMDDKARRIVSAVFEQYVEQPQLMPERFAQRVGRDGAARVAADYIAGMTDRFCQDEHARLFDPRMEA